MRGWIPRVRKAHRNAFEDSHTYYPPSKAEIEMIADTLLSIADPSLIKRVLIEDQLIGSIFV